MSYWFVGAVMIAGMIFGSIFTRLYIYYRTQQFLDLIKDTLHQEPDQEAEDTLHILCEYVDSRFFAYNVDTLNFLAHGKTLDELLSALDQRLSRSGNYHFHADPATAEILRHEVSSES
jgi:hypothetical protein